MRLDEPAAQGHYAKKQILSRSRLISWSHTRRFHVGLELARQFEGQTVLDYGCGDGTFLSLLMRGPHPPARAVGAEITHDLVSDCRDRLRDIPSLSFETTEELSKTEHGASMDGVICMEVLEHIVDLDDMLDRLIRFLKPGGKLVVSVPVETGIPVLVKQTVRRVAGWRGIGDYPGTTPYEWRELLKGVFAGSKQHVERPIHREPNGYEFHDHKGFNWMLLRDKIAERIPIVSLRSSPVAWLPPRMLASQVWMVGEAVGR